jgi:hypothetical protein
MKFSAFKITPEVIQASLGSMRATYAKQGRAQSFEAHAVQVIGSRVTKRPQQYLEFGPYWWAVKEVLRGADFNVGDRGDPLVAAEYRGASAIETLVAGEAFKDFYRQNYAAGSNRFDLTGEGEEYELQDPDMDALAAAAIR